ncbi:MAG TPA: flavodoxin domain-containing protein [Acidimicrobiales bacterium]|nr:flavodoxin domain-containing protein [Acidimicrobiales bacterium]
MRVLVTFGSTLGGTQELARIVADELHAEGFDVDLLPPGWVPTLEGYEAVVVGGALYANRWHKEARRFVRHHAAELRRVPTYYFSSGPLDDSASEGEIGPVRSVRTLMALVGARAHATFGGRLAADAGHFPVFVLARKETGDWRDADRVRAWTREVAGQLVVGRAEAG